MNIIIVGAGAAGFFAALNIKSLLPHAEVVILEKTQQSLSKVKISGGGRCNVTHSCFEPNKLLKGYPRGNKELLGPFYKFQPRDMIRWLEERGVTVKAEDDGRMFPDSNSSQTIIDCFKAEAVKLGVVLRYGAEVVSIRRSNFWQVELSSRDVLDADSVLVATGSLQKSYRWIEEVGHSIVSPVPSLFTFNIQDERLEGLSGVSVADVEVGILGYQQRGPLLITHWGLSGPAILKLSAWAARDLHTANYEANLEICFLPSQTSDSLRKIFEEKRKSASKQLVLNDPPIGIPKNLWKRLLQASQIPETRIFAQLSKDELLRLIDQLLHSNFMVRGKSIYKEEFVTCGGVSLDEIDFRRMESKIVPGLYFAGEVLNIDGITGGFNFQNAWTTAWIASQAIANSNV